MPEWINLWAPSRPPVPGNQPDVLVNLVVSPYHIPEAVRGVRLGDGRFRVEFRYIDGEEPHGKAIKLDSHVTAFEGRLTRRLLALEIDVAGIGARTVGVTVSSADQHERIRQGLDGAFAKLMESHGMKDRGALTRAQSALKSRNAELLQQLVPS